MKKTFKVTLGGIVSGLSLLAMLLTALIPVGTYALPAIAGVLLIVIVDEFDYKWGYLVYFAVSLLSFFITPDREAATLFIFFFGQYPITKALLEKIKNKVLEFIFKILIFNVSIGISFAVMMYFFKVDEVVNDLSTLTISVILGFLLIGNVVFLIYDLALTRLITAYITWFKPNFLKRL